MHFGYVIGILMCNVYCIVMCGLSQVHASIEVQKKLNAIIFVFSMRETIRLPILIYLQYGTTGVLYICIDRYVICLADTWELAIFTIFLINTM